jgi:hypothetical protein
MAEHGYDQLVANLRALFDGAPRIENKAAV